MALPIPKRYSASLNAIRKLPDPAFEELVLALSACPVRAKAKDVYTYIKDSVPSISPDDLEGMVEVTHALYHVREYSELARGIFLKELVDGIKNNDATLVGPTEMVPLRDRFSRLLNIESLNSLSKAVRLQRSEERIYCDAKILSDIRPIFAAEIGDTPVASVVVHNLEIGYHKDGKHRRVFIALDDVDLEKLADVVERAKKKAKAIESLLDNAKLPRLGA